MIRQAFATALTLSVAAGLTGCIERTIRITSEPPGALVTLNDEQIGRTPAEAEFLFHGDYDVRLELDGYEPIHEGRRAEAPLYEYPVIDLVAEALPITLENTQEWHFVLEPSPETLIERGELDERTFEADLIDRARDLRAQTAESPRD